MSSIRISGVNLPLQKHVCIALTEIYGIGRPRSAKICKDAGVNPSTKTKDLSENEVEALRRIVATFRVEGDLKREVALNIKRLVDLGCYRGIRHKKGLPVRGQRTRSNARTRKGRRKGVSLKKSADKK